MQPSTGSLSRRFNWFLWLNSFLAFTGKVLANNAPIVFPFPPDMPRTTHHEILNRLQDLPTPPDAPYLLRAIYSFPMSLREYLYGDPSFAKFAEDGSSVGYLVSKKEWDTKQKMIYSHAGVDWTGKNFQYCKPQIGDHLYPLCDYDYWRSKVLEALEENYLASGIPDKGILFLREREFSLANHRRFEILVTYKTTLLGYLRVYDGTPTSTYAESHPEYQLHKNKRFSQIYKLGLPQERVPFAALPVERLLGQLGVRNNQLEAFRREHSNKVIVEVGRYFLNRELGKLVAKQTKKILLTIMLDILNQLSGNNLDHVQIIASGTPTSTRLYKKEFGFQSLFDVPFEAMIVISLFTLPLDHLKSEIPRSKSR